MAKVELRADPRSRDSRATAWLCQSSGHDADHGEAEDAGDGPGMALEVAPEASVAADPGQGSLHDPALGQDDEAVDVASLDDLQGPAACVRDGLRHLGPLIARVADDALDEREQAPSLAQDLAGAVAVLDIGRMDDAQEQAERIDEDVPLAPRDLLARVIPLRVERRAPF